MKTVVLFEDGKCPRIIVNANPEAYDLRYALVNPVLPRGIPPHRWKKVGNHIEVMPEELISLDMPKALVAKAPLYKRKHVYLALASLAVALLLKLIFH